MSYMQDFLLEEEDVKEFHAGFSPGGGGMYRGCMCMSVENFFMNKKDQICPFSCALVPFIAVKAIMRFNLIPVHPQHGGLGMRPFGAGQHVD